MMRLYDNTIIPTFVFTLIIMRVTKQSNSRSRGRMSETTNGHFKRGRRNTLGSETELVRLCLFQYAGMLRLPLRKSNHNSLIFSSCKQAAAENSFVPIFSPQKKFSEGAQPLTIREKDNVGLCAEIISRLFVMNA